VEYNYRPEPKLLGGERSTEMPGYSCFLRDGDQIFHTYSTYARGSEYVGNAYTMLDMTVLGRQEDWEEPKGRSAPVRGGDRRSPADAEHQEGMNILWAGLFNTLMGFPEYPVRVSPARIYLMQSAASLARSASRLIASH
jgi:Bacterial protein of unknown function (DUF899)